MSEVKELRELLAVERARGDFWRGEFNRDTDTIANLRDALSSLLNCVDGQHEPDQLDRCKQRAREALAAATTPG